MTGEGGFTHARTHKDIRSHAHFSVQEWRTEKLVQHFVLPKYTILKAIANLRGWLYKQIINKHHMIYKKESSWCLFLVFISQKLNSDC